jgi:GAF domain-containing protein
MEPLAAADSRSDDGEMDAAHRRRQRPDDETGRQRAVDQLALRERPVDRRLKAIVEMARQAFETASAEVTIVDRDRQWTLVASGEQRGALPRQQSLCSRSIERRSPTLIGDTWQVPALRGNPLVAGRRAIRFYAAQPIESIIGVLCVWDTAPHDIDDFDVGALRDLALLAEAEIIADQRA